MKEEMLNLDGLTEEERDRILSVLRRDDELKSAQGSRVSQIESEINEIRMNGVLKPGEDGNKLCRRCRTPFGYFFNTGEFCPQCKCRVCKNCREFTLGGIWSCILCYKQRQLKALTGEWLAPSEPENNKSEDDSLLSAPELVRKSIRSKSSHSSDEDDNGVVKGGRNKNVLPLAADSESSTDSSGREELVSPKDGDRHRLNSLLATEGLNQHSKASPAQPVDTVENKHVKKVSNKRYVDSDSSSSDAEEYVVITTPPKSVAAQARSLPSSTSGFSTGRDSSGNSDHEDGNGSVYHASSARTGQRLHFDESSYRPHSELPSIDDLLAKSKAQHSPLSSMTSSPTPSTIGERLIDLAASAENSDAEADLQHDSDVDHDVFELEEEDIADGTSLQQNEYEIINVPPFDNEPIYIEYHDVSDASDALSIISENTEPSDDNYESEDDFEKVFRKAEADEVSLKGSVKETAETDLDSIIDEMSQQGDAYLKEDMRRIEQDFDWSDAESGSTIVDMDQPGAQLKRKVREEQSLDDIEVHSNTLNINSFVDEMNFFCAPTQSHSFDVEEGSSEDSESELVVLETPVPKKAPEKPAVNNPIVVTKAEQVKSEPVMKKDVEQEKTVARNDQGVKSANSQSRKVLLKNKKKSVSLDVPQKSKVIVPRVEMEAESDYSMSTDVSLDENHIDVKSFEDEMSFFCAPVRSPSFETLGNEADIDSQQKPDGKVNMEVLKSHSQTLDTAQHREENHLAGSHITDKTEAKIAQSNKKVTMKRSLSHDSKHKDKEITTKPDKEALKEKLSDIIPMENDTQVSCTQVKPIREDMRTEPETIVGIKDDSELQRKSSKQKQDETSVTVKEVSASKSEQVTEPAIKKYNEPEKEDEKEDQISVQIVNSGNGHSRKVLLKNNPERSASLDVPEKSMTNDHPKERQAESNHSPSMDVPSDENPVNGKTFEEEMSFFCAPQSTVDNEEDSEPLQRKSVEQKQEEAYVKETKSVKEQLPELSVEEEKLIQRLLSDLDVEIDESAENSAENSGNVDNTDEDSNIEHEEASKVSKNVDLESDLAGLEAEFVVKSEHGVEIKPMSQKQEVSNEEGSDESQTIQSTGSVKKTESEINSTEKDLASEPTTQEKSDSTDGGRLLETDAVETASSKEVETSVADTSEASDLSSSTADTDVLEDGSTNGSKKSQLQEGTVSGGRENISVTEKVDKSSEVNKIETTEKIETKETTSKVIDTAILDSGDKSKEKIDALREEPNSLKENKSVLSNISEDETHIESEDKAEQEVAAVLEITPDVHSEVRSEIVEDVRSEIKNDVRSEVVEDVSVQRQKEGEIKSVAEDQKEVELRDQEGDDPVKLTKGEDPSVLSTKTKIESNQSVKKDSDTIESEEIKEKCVEESDLKVKVPSNDIDINQPEKNVIQHQNSDMIKVKSVKMADNESTSSGQGDKNDLALVSANVSETSSEFSETVKSEENNNEIKSPVDSDNSLKVKDKKPKKSSLKKDTKFKQTVQSDTNVEVKEKKIKKSSLNRELEVKASSDLDENVNMSKKTTLKVESAEKLSSINEEDLEQQSMNDEATRRKILFKNDTPGGTNSQNLKPRKQKKKAVQFQDTDKENVIKTLAAGTVKNFVNGPAKTDQEGLSKWDQGVLANSTPKQKTGDETEPKKPPRKTGKAIKDNANSKTAARMITSDSWDDDTSVKPIPDEEKSQANSARLVTPASLVASEQTDASSIQGDSGNLTGTSQDGTASSPSHSKSPSQVSVPSIQVSSADGEAEEDRIEELDTSLRSHSSTFQQTFGGLFSSLGGSRESIASYYSQAGGYTYGLVEVKGAIQFAVDYKYKVGVLEIIVKQASELAAVDTKKQRSDPYVKTYLLPDRTRNGKRKTQRRKNDLNPVFNETLRYHVSKSGLGTRTLWLTVWHHDRLGKNVFLGEVTVPLTYFSFSSLPQWYTLQDREEMDESVMTYKGDLIVSLKYIPLENLEDSVDETGKKKKKKHKEGQLCVLIKEAKNLAAVRSNGYSDPFCKGYLLPDKGKHVKQKTMVVKQNLSPKWNYLFTFEDVSFEELPDRAMELTVWDHDRFSSNDFLGGARLNLGTGVCKEKEVDWMDAAGEEVHIWQSMINNPNAWVDATLTLRPSMDKQQ